MQGGSGGCSRSAGRLGKWQQKDYKCIAALEGVGVQGSGRRSRSAGRWRRKEQVVLSEYYMYFLNLEYLSQSTNLTLYLKI